MRIHDESGALGHALLRIQNAERRAEFAFDVGQHGEGQVVQIGVMSPPGVVDELAVGAASQDLRVAILKLLVEFAEGRDLRRADEGEVLRPEEINLPLILEVLVADGLKRFSLFEAHGGLEGISGKLLSNT